MTEAELREGFLAEADEILSDMQDRLDALSDAPVTEEDVAVLFRGMHSIKGGAAAFAMDDLVALAHAGEEVLDRRRREPARLTAAERDEFQRCADLMAGLVAAERGDPPPAPEALAAAIAALTGGTDPEGAPTALPAAEEPAPHRWRVTFTPSRDMFRTANEPILILRALDEMGTAQVRCLTATLPLLDSLDPEESYLGWEIVLATDATRSEVEEAFDFAEPACDVVVGEIAALDTSEAPAPDGADGPGPTIRVDLDRVDLLMNQVGELVIAHSMLVQDLGEAARSAHGRLGQQLSALELMIRDVQDSVMSIRAQPVKALFQRLARTVRETAAETGKSVTLETEGTATEIDKTLIERLAEPLTHLVRNAIDHGIETPEERRAAGKPAESVLKLSARPSGGRVVIQVTDDGAGLDREALLRKAVSAGHRLPAKPSEEEVDALVFHSGLSTRDAVTDLSGRGVGMSVVRDVVVSSGGRVEVASSPGAGTTFTIVLPLTLAVMDGLLVAAGGHTLVVPLDSVSETRTIRDGEIEQAGPSRRILQSRGTCLELIDLAAALGYGPAPPSDGERVALMIDGRAGERVAFLIDEVHDRRQIVIKSLDGSIPAGPGIAGATILGDGGVALIVDPASIAPFATNLEAAA